MSLKQIVSKALAERTGYSAFIFGSALTGKEPSDIDLLITYDSKLVSIAQALEVRQLIVAIAREQLAIPVDVSLLSLDEAAETNFVEEESCKPLSDFNSTLA